MTFVIITYLTLGIFFGLVQVVLENQFGKEGTLEETPTGTLFLLFIAFIFVWPLVLLDYQVSFHKDGKD